MHKNMGSNVHMKFTQIWYFDLTKLDFNVV